MALLKLTKIDPIKKWFIDWIKKHLKKEEYKNKNKSKGKNLCKPN